MNVSSSLASSSLKKRVMLVDDSIVVRGLLRKIIEKYPEFDVVASANDGRDGVLQYKAQKPDIVLLDIEMPNMNGLEALQEITSFDPGAQIIMCSSLTQSGAEMTVKALELGALDCLAKPTTDSIDRGENFESELIRMLRGLERRDENSFGKLDGVKAKVVSKVSTAAQLNDIEVKPYPDAFIGSRPKVLAIGSSTGGPKALVEVLSRIDKNIDAPIFVTQHMPKGFTQVLADNLARDTGFHVHEAQSEMLVKSGQVYVAPGGKHMKVEQRTSGCFIVLDDGPAVNFCKPAVDIMLDSLLEQYKTGVVTVVLTGMGDDGCRAAKRLVEASDLNVLIAQDELTSVVWGMPGAVAKAGICNGVFPLSNVAPAINHLMRGRRPVG